MSFRTNVYIDGFNFYYGCLKGKNHLKWLNFIQLSKLILGTNPNFSNSAINKVYFFTALVKNTQKKQRQNIYLEIFKGNKKSESLLKTIAISNLSSKASISN